MLKQVLTPKQVADAIGVSEASLKRWCDKGLIPATRTAGGHRRLPISGVVQQVTRIVFGLYFAGHSVVDICDKVVASVFHEIGHRWEDGRVQVYQERRSCEICTSALFQLRSALPAPPANAPTAIGATLEHDPYTLASAMVAVSLREMSWKAESYGPGHPCDTLAAAIQDMKPRLFWLSVSSIPSAPAFIAECNNLYDVAVANGTALALGGRALTDQIRKEIRYSAFCDNLSHLTAFAKTIEGVPVSENVPLIT